MSKEDPTLDETSVEIVSTEDGIYTPPPPPEIDDIPEELQFTSRNPNARKGKEDKMTIRIDDEKFTLRRPPKSALRLLAGSFASNANSTDREYATQNLINVSLDEGGRVYLRERMMDTENDFDDDLLAHIVESVLKKWGDGVVKDAIAEPSNRAEKRAADKANRKKK